MGSSVRRRGFYDKIHSVCPDAIILGGSVAQTAQSLMMAPLIASLRQRAFYQSVCDMQVLVSELGEDAAAVGASLLAAGKMLEAFAFSGALNGPLSADRSKSATA